MRIKKLTLIIIIQTWGFNVFAQYQKISGSYKYSRRGYSESILLEETGRFNWKMVSEFIHIKIEGNWQLRNDTLVLDSHPQKDKLIVFELFKKKQSNRQIIIVRDKENRLLNYTLVGISKNNDTVKFTNQWNKTKISNSINRFYILDSKGLASPVYKIKNVKTTHFKVYFETMRVFENEKWGLKTN